MNENMTVMDLIETEKAMDAQKQGLRRKLLEIMRECSYIQRDKKNEFHRYTYASEAAIKDRVHQSLVAHGVLFHMSEIDTSAREVTTDKGGKQWVISTKYLFWFEDVDTGECSAKKTITGCGADALDKSPYKAYTGALKYALTGSFLIPTGDDPENEEKVDKAEAKRRQKEVADKKLAELQAAGATVRDVKPGIQFITDGMRKRMFAITKEAGLSPDEAKLILKGYGFQSASDVTAPLYDSICGDIARCGVFEKFMPLTVDYKPGQHVRVNGDILRLSDDGTEWEVIQ